MAEKPRTAAGYKPEQVARVRATCLYLATKLGDLMNDLVVVGGLVPSLLIDQGQLPERGAAGDAPSSRDASRNRTYSVTTWDAGPVKRS